MPSLKRALLCLSLALGLSPSSAPAAPVGPALDWAALPLPAINGGVHAPATFQGKVVLVVNTASQCGFTKQYDGLQALWAAYRDRGLVVLGVPSDDFGGQEPGTNAEVQDFCRLNYGVNFPLLEKQVVSGSDAHPLYRWAAERTGVIGVPHWNFHKLLIGRDGRLLDWFASTTEPGSAKMKAAVEAALAEPAGAK